LAAVFIGYRIFASGRDPAIDDESTPERISVSRKRAIDQDPGTNVETSPKAAPPTASNSSGNEFPAVSETAVPAATPSLKKYLEMSDGERRQYLGEKAMRIAQIIGNRSSDPIPAAAVDKIKGFADAYASRAKVKPLTGCRFGDNLQTTFERASKNSPFIVRAFNEKGIDPRIGLYLAMIESEHCVCLQSPTGPLGMFQFTKATAEMHGLKVFKGASQSNPDERCEPEPAARAAASYMKALTGRYGTGPSSVPLAIGSYNSGEGGLSSNLQKALDSNQGLPRDFWTLIANGEKLSKQFQAENFKYVPKFFAAAIIGENPQDFGLNLQPVSTYSK
ncbi:MAG: transglycosylase SLT domain-containing protein, partial [Pyrinomonadaceae bacterium]